MMRCTGEVADLRKIVSAGAAGASAQQVHEFCRGCTGKKENSCLEMQALHQKHWVHVGQALLSRLILICHGTSYGSSADSYPPLE